VWPPGSAAVLIVKHLHIIRIIVKLVVGRICATGRVVKFSGNAQYNYVHLIYVPFAKIMLCCPVVACFLHM